MLSSSGNSKHLVRSLSRIAGLCLLLLVGCRTDGKSRSELTEKPSESCGSPLSPSQMMNIDYAVQQDFADDGQVNGSWNTNGQQPDGIMVYDSHAAAVKDLADDGDVNGSVVEANLPSVDADREADSKDGRIDGIYCR